ncbi:unnamed protein product [Allacma fusca]|uniref:Serine carboxypeptidase n=1 Tax=Allacma fusca TaxID=39272 RepID=A0A8J2J4P8_9HEXA|nr:unnamed protein product [Allacma fusca]
MKILVCFAFTIWQIVLGREFYSLNHQKFDSKKLTKEITQGMTVGDTVEGSGNDKLFLTQLIFRGAYDKARSLALVDPELSPVKSYSGFLTVNITFNTNLFFWFFPAAYNPEQAPVVLWLNGGPGASSLFGLFTENGPYYVDSKGYLNMRSNSWALTHSMIYIDNPAGVGFSFTEDEDGFCRNQNQVAGDLYSALSQFFLLFPSFTNQDLYLGSQSYGAKYIASLGMRIHEANSANPAVKINFKGLILSSPYIDPMIQADYGSFLYSHGMIDDQARKHFDEERLRFQELSAVKDWVKAHTLMDELFHGDLTPYATYYSNATGFQNFLNYLQPSFPPSFSQHRAFLRQPFVRTAIHVGSQKYHSFSKKVARSLKEDFHQSIRSVVERLLELDYKILVISAQLDVVCHAPGIHELVHSLQWSGKEEFANASRTVWRVNNEHAGFLKVAKNLAYLVMRNSGHAIPHDQPLWTYTLINEFTSEFLFEEQV